MLGRDERNNLVNGHDKMQNPLTAKRVGCMKKDFVLQALVSFIRIAELRWDRDAMRGLRESFR